MDDIIKALQVIAASLSIIYNGYRIVEKIKEIWKSKH